MATIPIVRLGHPSLRIKSKSVSRKELSLPRVQKFIDDLSETCVAANGAGIAAPQVAVNRRIIVVHVDSRNARYPNRTPFPLTVVVNPRVQSRSRKLSEDWEGDLSFNIRGKVPRPVSCVVTGWDRYGDAVRYDLKGFPARVFQHEIDHLDGIFLIDRVRRHETLCDVEAWEMFWEGVSKPLSPTPELFSFP